MNALHRAPRIESHARRPRYGAFISYSHAASRDVARGLQKWLQSYAKPWYRWRAVNVFRDETDLAAAPALWSKITLALDDSSHFILLASPEAAQSKWVKREIHHWLGKRHAQALADSALDTPVADAQPARGASLLIALTDGEIAWRDGDSAHGRGDFDWQHTTALPRALAGVFSEEPQWVDLRQIVRRDDLRNSLSRSNAEFMQAVAQLAAPIRGIVDVSRLVGEDFRQYRRTIRTAWAAVLALALLAAAALWQWHEAVLQREQTAAELRAKQISQSRFLVDQSRQVLATHDAVTAALLALEALPADTGARDARPYLPEAEVALFAAVAEARELEVFGGHTDGVRAAASSPDGTRAVTASDDGTAQLWDVASHAVIAVLRGHESGLTATAFSADGRRIITASGDASARIWDATSGTLLAVLRGHQQEVTSATFNADGTRALTASIDDTARVSDAASGAELLVLRGGEDLVGSHIRVDRVNSAAYSPDGTRIVTASEDGTVQVWDATDGKPLAQLRGHQGGVTAAAFTPDSKGIVTASADGSARLWNAATAAELAVLEGHTHTVISAAFNADGTRLVTASYDRTARIWDLAARAKVAALLFPGGDRPSTADTPALRWDPEDKQLAGHTDFVSAAAFSPDGARVVTASWDGTVRLWDAATTTALTVLGGHTDHVYSAAFDADGSRVMTASADHTARLWSTKSAPLEVMRIASGTTYDVAFSVDGTRIATADSDGTARVWDADSGRELAIMRGHQGDIRSVAFSLDGKRVVTASGDGSARVWDAANGTQIALLRGHTGRVMSAAFSPDGAQIVTASHDSSVRLWEATSGRQLSALGTHDNLMSSAAFSQDGTRIVTASFDGTARVYDTATGAELVVLEGHEAALVQAAFSPDDARIVTASDDDTARVWDAASGRELAVLRGHENALRSAAFGPDGMLIVTASLDRTVRVWTASNGALRAVLRGHGAAVLAAEYSPDETRVVSASADGATRVWRAFATTQALIDHAHRILPRELTTEQRAKYYLDAVVTAGR
ncbi:MAG: TIR domain-containing protein [Planctomycetota bacterium]